MDHTNRRLHQLLEELRKRKNFLDLQGAAHWLVYEHPWKEVTEARQLVFQRLRQVLLKDDFAPEELYNVLKDRKVRIVGGHFSVRIRLENFLQRSEAGRVIRELIGAGDHPPDTITIKHFIEQAVSLGFRDQRGRPDRRNAALLASVLLAAVYPDYFVDFVSKYWQSATDFFGWSTKPPSDYSEALVWAGQAARNIAQTSTYQQYFAPVVPDIPPNWVIGGLVHLLGKADASTNDPDFREAVHAVRETPLSISGGNSAMLSPFEVWEVLRNYNPQVILQGPPGSGKTYLAEQVVRLVAGRDDVTRYRLSKLDANLPEPLPVIWELVQFHPSYTYEDFVRGLVTRVRPEGVIFQAEDRLLARAAAVAARHSPTPVILILDEINRADLARVLGELIYALERDRRGEPVATQYGVGNPPDSTLILPPNLYLIGTMNTADRSIALVDYAIRRRFSFLSVLPQVEVVEAFYQDPQQHKGRQEYAEHLGPRVTALYQAVYDLFDSLRDADDIRIGHSYFLVKGCRDNRELSLEEWADTIAFRFAFEVVPMLAEYRKERRLPDRQEELIVEGERFFTSVSRQRETRISVRDWLMAK